MRQQISSVQIPNRVGMLKRNTIKGEVKENQEKGRETGRWEEEEEK